MIALTIAALLAASPPVETLLPGTYANEQQAGSNRAVPWTSARTTANGAGFTFQSVDAFGASIGPPVQWQVTQTAERVTIRAGRCRRDFARVPAGLTIINQSRACVDTAGPTTFVAQGMAMTLADGTPIEMQRGRFFTCRAAIARDDGMLWSGTALRLHDAGGRVLVSTEEKPRRQFTLRLHNDAYPLGTGKPGLGLYVYADDSRQAIASGTAAPGASHVAIQSPAINVQCTLAAQP